MSGTTLVVGDVHGCANELAELLERTAPSRVLLVGDLFTKGPAPREVWKILEGLPECVAVLGNHDAAVLAERKTERWRDRLPRRAFRWLKERPHVWQEPGLVLVHAGLHPTAGVPGTPRRTALNVRRWPDDGRGEQSRHPFWWERYDGPGLVLYGHDARRGLIDRRPITLGLDTGCVYGGALTGYLVEADTIVQVPARQVYRAV